MGETLICEWCKTENPIATNEQNYFGVKVFNIKRIICGDCYDRMTTLSILLDKKLTKKGEW